MLAFNIFNILVLSVTLAKCYSGEQEDVDVYSLGYANNYFAVNLHKKLSEITEGNVFFSPLAVSSVLVMLYRGARGETAEELRNVLGYEKFLLEDSTVFSSFQYYLTEVIGNMNPKVYQISCISAMIVDNSFPVLPSYKSEMQDIFQAFVQDANLAEEGAAVVDKMNTWAKIKTKGAISSLADRIDPETTLYLTSAAYFKGAWKVKFNPEDTKYHPFYNRGQTSNPSNVPMMHCYATIRYFEEEYENFTAIELAYEGRNVSMVLVLPNAIDGLPELERSMTASMLSYIRRQMYYVKVHLTIPKFKLQTDRSLARPLRDMGLSKIFTLGGDLSGIIQEGESLALDDVKHKAFIDVNERGSIAAAITRAIMMKSMPLPIPDPEFIANHPFLFAIFDTRNSLILFMGKINTL